MIQQSACGLMKIIISDEYFLENSHLYIAGSLVLSSQDENPEYATMMKFRDDLEEFVNEI